MKSLTPGVVTALCASRPGAFNAAAIAGTAALLLACAGIAPQSAPVSATGAAGAAPRTASVQRTANGVAHIQAPDLETLAYGMAYAYAQDNFCLTADHLVTVRGERSRFFGAAASGALGLRRLPNEQIDLFIAAHMDDTALAAAAARLSGEVQAQARGYVAGWNRYLADHAGRLPAACNAAPWVRPMTAAEYLRIGELTAVQAGIGALADAMLSATPPQRTQASIGPSKQPPRIDVAGAEATLREAGLLDSPFGSNAWAFGRESTATPYGMLLGNPHFPWVGTNRFWQVHLTVPGRLDVMGVTIGTAPMVVIGFNQDVAWSHTVSTGRRFTLHELRLVPGDPTSYLIDGQPEKMSQRDVSTTTRDAQGQVGRAARTIWSTRYGPVVVLPRAGLTWTAERAYALQDANRLNMRGGDTYLAFAQARSVEDLRRALAGLGTPWVNTIATDRRGQAMYADASVVPDVDAAQLQRCAPSEGALRLRASVGLVVLDGSRAECDWRRDGRSPVPGVTPIERLPVALRSDWVHNSNDSFYFTHPKQRFGPISPMVGDGNLRNPRTRSGLIELQQMLGRGPVTLESIQRQLFSNRNLMAALVLPDLLGACDAGAAPTAEARDGCAALRGWDRLNNADSRGAHLFREFWRELSATPNIWRVPTDPAQPAATPSGLRLADPAVAERTWAALGGAVKAVRAAGFALDARLGDVQRPAITDDPIALHGGHGSEGVLNFLGSNAQPAIGNRGIRVDYGTSYVQTVTFDERGPVAQALLTYGQSTDPASPHVADQLRLYAAKTWPALPFHAEDVQRQRVGEVLLLQRP